MTPKKINLHKDPRRPSIGKVVDKAAAHIQTATLEAEKELKQKVSEVRQAVKKLKIDKKLKSVSDKAAAKARTAAKKAAIELRELAELLEEKSK